MAILPFLALIEGGKPLLWICLGYERGYYCFSLISEGILKTVQLYETAGIAFVCDSKGEIREIIRDELGCGKQITPGQSFIDFVDAGSKERAHQFLYAVQNNKAVFDCELNVLIRKQIITLHFAGSAIDGKLFIIGAKSLPAGVRFSEEPCMMDNEHTDGARKDMEMKGHVGIDDEAEFYNELSLLNKQLIGLQYELTKKNVELEKNKEMFETLAESSLIGVFLYRDRYIYVNPTMTKLTGYSDEELFRMSPWEIVAPEFRERARNIIGKRLKGGKHPVLYKEIKLLTKNGEEKWAAVYSNTIEYKGGFAGLGNLIDITEKKKLEEELILAATTDTLTGVFNRRKFKSLLAYEIERTNRYNISLSLCMFDIDHFKGINDTYGHLTGDFILKKVADIVRNTIRKVDSLGRWGGEEFAILAPEINLKESKELAEKIRKSIEKYHFQRIPRLTCSFGVAQFKVREPMDSFIKRADDALYNAKNKGRNRVETGQ